MSTLRRAGRQALLLIAAAAGLVSGAVRTEAAGTLVLPIDVEAARASMGAPDTAKFFCHSQIAPFVDMSNMPTFYKPSKTMSQVDPAQMRDYLLRLKPTTLFGGIIDLGSDRYVLARPARPEIAACVGRHLLAWAKGGALLGGVDTQPQEVNHRQAIMVQAWDLTGAVIAYAKVRDGAGLSDADRATIEAWFHQLASSVMGEFTRTDPRPDWLSMNANHSHWAGAAVGLVGALTNDRAMFDFAMRERDRALDVVSQEGALPGEMWRGPKSGHYQNFALLPISLLVVLGDANKEPLSPERDAAMVRATEFTVKAVSDPTEVARIAGSRQEATRTARDLVWIDVILPYMRRTHPDVAARADAAAAPLRPMSYLPFTGGSVTGLFGYGT